MPAKSTYKSSYVEQARKIAQLGATDEEVAEFFDVCARTIYRWKHTHPEFAEALTVGKDVADQRVISSLYQRACGYEHDDVKIFMPANAEAPVYAPYKARVAGDVTAAIFWLKNRRPQEWRDRHEMAHSLEGDLAAKLIAARGRAGLLPAPDNGEGSEA